MRSNSQGECIRKVTKYASDSDDDGGAVLKSQYFITMQYGKVVNGWTDTGSQETVITNQAIQSEKQTTRNRTNLRPSWDITAYQSAKKRGIDEEALGEADTTSIEINRVQKKTMRHKRRKKESRPISTTGEFIFPLVAHLLLFTGFAGLFGCARVLHRSEDDVIERSCAICYMVTFIVYCLSMVMCFHFSRTLAVLSGDVHIPGIRLSDHVLSEIAAEQSPWTLARFGRLSQKTLILCKREMRRRLNDKIVDVQYYLSDGQTYIHRGHCECSEYIERICSLMEFILACDVKITGFRQKART
uniref:Uncharacterized protein n=1 Tax=Ascaris lumbricoides TaxID=6252 RepID=A0A9J2Q7B1_ASCLU